MRHSFATRIFSPSMSARPARVVGVKLPSIAWALALLAVGLGPASVIAEGETPTTTITLHNASGVFGTGEKVRSKPDAASRRSTANIRRISSRRMPRHVGRPGSDRVILWRRPPRGM